MAFVNVEKWLVDLLADRLEVPVATGALTGQPRFLVIQRLGGVSTTRISDQALMAVEAYARFEDDAVDLLNEARQIILWLSAERHPDVMVYRVSEAGGPVNLPDPLLPNLSRYTASYELHIRG